MGAIGYLKHEFGDFTSTDLEKIFSLKNNG